MDFKTSGASDEKLPDTTQGIAEDKPDLLPEYCHYRDEGCEFAGSCLRCPFPRCLYEEPGGRRHWLKEQRDREIARLFRGGNRGVKELAGLFRLSQRTIQRALKSTLVASTSLSGAGFETEKER